MKASHRAILNHLSSGGYLAKNDFSFRTQFIRRNGKTIATVRSNTIDEMVASGVLVLRNYCGTSAYRPNTESDRT